MILNSNASGQPIWTTWDGASVNQFDVLIKYTFDGDLDLAGSVTQADVNQVQSEIGTGQGWANGQFLYNGLPTSEIDYPLAESAYVFQGLYPLTVPIPEPSGILLAAIAVGVLLPAIRCQRRKTGRAACDVRPAKLTPPALSAAVA